MNAPKMNSTTPETQDSDASLVLQADNFDLWGSRLIEASAGTGKTWTIAALYLRLVLGHGGEHAFERALRPSEILVMTFTRAATRELSDRIRERLLVAAQWFRGNQPADASDPFLETLMSAYPAGPTRDHAAWLLALAAESMDDASVHTIDAWCQRMLKEHAFDSGCLFDEALVADEDAMRLEATQDYWRQSCYPLNVESLEQVLRVWASVEKMVEDMKSLLGQNIPAEYGHGPLEAVLNNALTQRTETLSHLKEGWVQRATAMQDWLDDQTSDKKNGWNGQKLSAKHYTGWLNTLKGWANGTIEDDVPDLKTGWDRFTPEGLLTARKEDAPAITLPAMFAEFEVLKAALDQLPSISEALRKHAAASVGQRLLLLKRQSGTFGFADMLTRLDSALRGKNATRLRERILAQYPVVLIDEFQDTSPLQYQIFDQIYRTETNDRASALLLIGDPKQSIYGFRGADIYSYMHARKATTGRHYVLETNFRSTDALVGVVNHWFGHGDTARQEGAFMYRQGDVNPLPFVKVRANGRNENLVTSVGPMPAMTLVHDLEIRNADESRRVFAARCAEQIVTWLNDDQAGFAEAEKPLKPLRPADIAVLVRTGKEADAVRHELALRSVASVYLSDRASVFDSAVARDLVHWLRAVAAPQDVRLVRAGLAIGTLGLTFDELGWLASSDDAFDARSGQLRQLRTVWQNQGVLAMLRQTLHQLGLAATWLKDLDGERKLTDFLHMAELLQTASSSLDGEQALIRWLQTEISEGGAQGDEQVVRLESDADLVKVITIHKSKGLEYSVVCLPYGTSFRKKDRRFTSFVNLADEEGNRHLRLEFDNDELALADRDRLREDLRLLYVALTRARHSLWVGFSALKTGRSDACISHESATGYLIGGTEPISTSNWLGPLTQLAAGDKNIVLKAAEKETPRTLLSHTSTQISLQVRPDYIAAFDRSWKIGSFSQLTRDLSTTPSGSELSLLQTPRPADDESDGKEASDAQVNSKTASVLTPHGWHKFPKGAEAGNFLHDQLEWLTTEQFALPGNEQLTQRLQRRCERAGRGKHADFVVTWLSQVVQTYMPGPAVSLMELEHVLPEMEFWLPADRIEAKEIDAHCCAHILAGVERPRLGERQLHGMLMGFADLVFEHAGKYWILDYKSNYLGEDDAAYSGDALANAMAH
ncbi:MAG TPA: exodeoxyribonuclease V subunit beta, partial [Rhodoferax sp.]|nr:exodeoxyribonuclease V subunit beta [Rhodoferax sp.]